ncbi:MAG: nitroreductase family protein [Candidatus Heimdallarchaeota archaeon]|nr:nitroreductase family protein [Candidatus Heimdallarchaeota archaeon]
MKNILSRRSIRKFTDQTVSDEQITSLLKAAMSAPSAANKQPWEFIVIRKRETLDKIPEFHKYTKMLATANLAIVVCGNTTKADTRGFWIQDCAAATQNILLAANSLSLGSVWCGVYPNEEIYPQMQKLLELPEEIYPVSIIALGYPDEEKPPSERYDENKIHHEKW